MGGVLMLSRAMELQTEIKGWLEAAGFEDVAVTGKENEELNTAICNKKPRLVIIDSLFFQDGTACRVGDLVKVFLKLNVAVVSFHDFDASRAPWFIWEGAKSYLSLWEGYGEFQRGLRIVREGGQYISPKVQRLIDHCDVWPDTKSRMTKRRRECLVMLCCGLIPVQIGEILHISRSTVDRHLNDLYRTFHAGSREEMVALAWEMELVTPKDIRLYNKKKERLPLPEWAAVKKKCDRFYFD